MNRVIIFLSAMLVCMCSMAQTEVKEKEFPFEFQASYVGDFAGNVVGGKQLGFGYLGYGTLGITFDTEKAGWWKGGQLVLSGATTHGTCPSENWLGDFQVADNIEAGNHAFLQELYFQQILGHVEIMAGLQDFNAAYAFTDKAGLFLNSSFGINSILSSTFGVPIFPITSWGLNVKWNIKDWVNWQVGAFDSPFGFDDNPYNVHWRFIPEKGAIVASEFEFKTNINDQLEGSYKIGVAWQTAQNNIEVHFCGEQEFWKKDERSMAAFLMAAYSPQSLSENYVHLGGGFHFGGVFSKQGKDNLGIAVSSSLSANDYKHETVVELTYQYVFNEHFFLQPDFQYIINPAAGEDTYKSPLFMALRVGIDF